MARQWTWMSTMSTMSTWLVIAWSLAIGCGKSSQSGGDDDDDSCPWDVGGDWIFVTVTEGSATTLAVYPDHALPSFAVTGGMATQDSSIATLTPSAIHWTPGSRDLITVSGIDDGSADAAGYRTTPIGGVVFDCGGTLYGQVGVVDRESLQVLASPWDVQLAAAGSIATVTFTLTQAPPDDLDIAIAGGDVTATVSPPSFTLGSDNWSTGVPVTVTAGGGFIGIAQRFDIYVGSGAAMPYPVWVYVGGGS